MGVVRRRRRPSASSSAVPPPPTARRFFLFFWCLRATTTTAASSATASVAPPVAFLGCPYSFRPSPPSDRLRRSGARFCCRRAVVGGVSEPAFAPPSRGRPFFAAARSPSSLTASAAFEAEIVADGPHSPVVDVSKLDARSAERRIVKLGREGKTDEALSLYYAVRDSDDDDSGRPKLMTTRVWNAAIDACARSRPPRIAVAREIFEEALDGGGGNKGRRRRRRSLRPNVFTFGSLMSCHANAGDADGAAELLKTMQDEHEVRPNAVVYSTAISACERSRPPRSNLALSLLRESISGSEPTRTIVEPMTVAVYNAALSALARDGEWRVAVRLLEEMEGGGRSDDGDASSSGRSGSDGGEGSVVAAATDPPDGTTTKEGRRDDDDGGDGENPGPRPPLLLPLRPGATHPAPDAVTYGTVLAACERSGEWERVLRYAEALRARDDDEANDERGGARLDGMALTSALHACQRLGRADEALGYLELMKSLDDDDGDGRRRGRKPRKRKTNQRGGPRAPLRGPDGVAYRLAISACARSSPPGSRWRDAVRLLEEMESVTGDPPDVVAYTAAMAGCAEGGEWKRAFALLDRMRRRGVEPNVVTFAVVVTACANASAKAARGCDDDDDVEGKDEGEEEEGATSCVADRIESPMKQALKLLNVMKKDDSVVDPNVVVYNAAMRACAEGFHLKGAFELMEDLKGRGLVPTIVTYGTLMTACERAGDVGAVSDVFRMMREHEGKGAVSDGDGDGGAMMKPNEICYGAAISCCRKAREPERAFLLLRKMLKDGLSPNVATFNTVLLAQTQSKSAEDLDRAVVVYKLLRSSERAAPRAKPNRQTYNILIPALANAGRPTVAESLLRRMREDDDGGTLVPDVDLYTSTIASYERTGQPLQALRLMESMNKEGGYDFYEVKVLDAAFKGAVSLANVVGRGLRTTTPTPPPSSSGREEEGDGTNGVEEEEGAGIDFDGGATDDDEVFGR